MLEDLFAYPLWRPRVPILFDNRQLVFNTTPIMEWLAAGDVFYRRQAELAYCKVAVLVATLGDFHLTQRFDKILKYRMTSIAKVFMVENEAIDWLAEFADVSDQNGWE